MAKNKKGNKKATKASKAEDDPAESKILKPVSTTSPAKVTLSVKKGSLSTSWDVMKSVEDLMTKCRGEECTRHAICVLVSDLAPEDEWPVCAECRDTIKSGTQETSNTSKIEIAKEEEQEPTNRSTPTNNDAQSAEEEDVQCGETEAGAEKESVYAENQIKDPSGFDTPIKSNIDLQADDLNEDKDVEPSSDSLDGVEQDTSEDNAAANDAQKAAENRSPDSAGESEDEEQWELLKIFSIEEITGSTPHFCDGEKCKRKPAVLYKDLSSSEEWSSCLDCQEIEFGGWPEEPHEIPVKSLTGEHIRVLRKHCSKDPKARIPSFLSMSTGERPNSDDIGSLDTPQKISNGPSPSKSNEDEEEPDEAWDLVKVFSIAEITGSRPRVCITENCPSKAAVLYQSSGSNEKWYSCLDCQEEEFGGWPETAKEIPIDVITNEHAKVLRKHCSQNPTVSMPDLSVTTRGLKSPAPTAPNKDASHVVTPLVAELEANMPKKPASRAALDMHKKWQQEAEKMGGPGARIVVDKDTAKKLIFDVLHDAFAPMNISQLHKTLKATVPPPVLKSCLEEMSLDMTQGNALFADSDNEEDMAESKPSAKKASSNDPYSLVLKMGRNANTSLYYVDYTKQPNQGNGLTATDKNALYSALAQVDVEKQNIQRQLNGVRSETAKMLSEPTNEELVRDFEDKQAELEEWQSKAKEAKEFQANATRKDQIKRRLQHMCGEWRKRRRLCLDFLTTFEEMTEGMVRRSKCLAGDGAIDIESDESVVENALAFRNKKKMGVFKKAPTTTQSLADDSFIGVRLDSQGCAERVYAD